MSVIETISPENLSATRPIVLTSRVMETFFERLLGESRPISTLTIVSPWISNWESGNVGLDRLVRWVDARQIRTLIVTRPPLEPWHSEALDLFKRSSFVSIFLVPELHAKIFVCESVPVGFGLVGSANLTRKSLTNFEVAVLFYGRGMFSALLKDLKILAWQDLRRMAKKY